jgi:hypothetical protein
VPTFFHNAFAKMAVNLRQPQLNSSKRRVPQLRSDDTDRAQLAGCLAATRTSVPPPDGPFNFISKDHRTLDDFKEIRAYWGCRLVRASMQH